MEDWNNIKNELQQVKSLLKDIVKNVWNLGTKKLNIKVSKKPLKYMIISNVSVFCVMFFLSLYWFIQYKVIQKNQDKASYVLSQELERQKDSIEIEAQALSNDIYKNKIDSLQNLLRGTKVQKTAHKPRFRHKVSNHKEEEKSSNTAVTNASEDDFTPLP